MTIAATYPAAVIGMSLLRLMKGSLLEENIARTVGAIGESVAAGAVFTIPAFVLAGLWPSLGMEHYWESVALMVIGGLLGILFVTLLRRVMVEDPELPFPESVAASEIHKAGQQGSKAAKILFANMGFGGLMYFLSQVNLFWYTKDILINIPKMASGLRLGPAESERTATGHGGMSTVHIAGGQPGVSGSGLHYWAAAGVTEFCRRRGGVGIAGSTPNLFSGTQFAGNGSAAQARRRTGEGSRSACGIRLCGRSRWAACWWAPDSRSSACVSN